MACIYVFESLRRPIAYISDEAAESDYFHRFGTIHNYKWSNRGTIFLVTAM